MLVRFTSVEMHETDPSAPGQTPDMVVFLTRPGDSGTDHPPTLSIDAANGHAVLQLDAAAAKLLVRQLTSLLEGGAPRPER